MAVHFYNEGTDYMPKGRVKLNQWVRQTIHNEGFRVGEIGYIFCSSDYHIDINRQYLGHDYHTDVITFDYSDLEGRKVVSGDIFIDPETVADNADLLGTNPKEEQLRVIIHGILHLCGYKDKSDSEAAQMRAKEDFYLARLPK
ncbi:MAG: rRNA maturation RNase YbeY [Tidjanibacter sp.]|nr:rRNA maturation RNase YbeY [Tidjanibacter sp.]MBQ5807354.1 rRNA maturation RNase YbeY [Tidjanibacter sp.]